jgi:hypothetical protein
MTTEDKIVKAIEAAARRISIQVANVCSELHQIRIRENEPEMEEENEPEPETEEQPAEDKTEVRDTTAAFQADTVAALECCTQSGGCKGCPLINDDKCANDLMLRALTTIKQLQKQLEPRAEERFELTDEDKATIRAVSMLAERGINIDEL